MSLLLLLTGEATPETVTSSTTIPACQSAILTILQARPALAGIKVDWPPTKDEDFNNNPALIWLENVTSEDDWAAIGAYSRRETYRIGLAVWVSQWGDDPGTTSALSLELWAEVETALRDDLTAGTPQGSESLLRAAGVQQYGSITFNQQIGPASAEKWGARVNAQITFTATIRTV